MTETKTLIIGIGNRYRGDDAFGILVAQELARRSLPDVSCLLHDGEPAGLMECWQEAEHVILIDAVSSGATPGDVYRFDLALQAVPEEFNLYSTHAFGVPQAVELARALGKLPSKIGFIGVEGENFDAGETLSPPMEVAKDAIIAELLTLLDIKESTGA